MGLISEGLSFSLSEATEERLMAKITIDIPDDEISRLVVDALRVASGYDCGIDGTSRNAFGQGIDPPQRCQCGACLLPATLPSAGRQGLT